MAGAGVLWASAELAVTLGSGGAGLAVLAGAALLWALVVKLGAGRLAG